MAMSALRNVLALVALLTAAAGVCRAESNTAIGEVTALVGEASITGTNAARSAALRKGSAVNQGDRVSTAPRSFIALRFTDGTRFTLGPNSEFLIGEVSSGTAGEANGVFSAEVLRGAFRFVTGLIARQRPRAMQVRTGVVATIGIRGTTVGGEVAGESATVVLLENEDDPAKPSAIEVGNSHGSVTIDQTGYGTTVPDANSPPTPPARMSLRAIENLVRNINSIQRISVPRPMIR